MKFTVFKYKEIFGEGRWLKVIVVVHGERVILSKLCVFILQQDLLYINIKTDFYCILHSFPSFHKSTESYRADVSDVLLRFRCSLYSMKSKKLMSGYVFYGYKQRVHIFEMLQAPFIKYASSMRHFRLQFKNLRRRDSLWFHGNNNMHWSIHSCLCIMLLCCYSGTRVIW